MNRQLLFGTFAFFCLFFVALVVLVSGDHPTVSEPSAEDAALSAANAAWARHLNELFTPGHQIQTEAKESLWLTGPMSPDPNTGIEDHYDDHVTRGCLVYLTSWTDPENRRCTKKLAAQGKILSLPPVSLVEVVKRDRNNRAMIEVRVLRMGKRTTTKAERAHVWWMVDIDLEDPETWVNPEQTPAQRAREIQRLKDALKTLGE